MVKDLLAKYTDDTDLVEKTDILLSYFSIVENEAELVSWPMEYFVNLPHITIEMCQLIDKVKRNEEEEIKKWVQNNADYIERIKKTEMAMDEICRQGFDNENYKI